MNNDDQQSVIPDLPGVQQTNVSGQSSDSGGSLDPNFVAMNDLQRQVSTLPQEASDTDLIEKEWVTALQDVVAHTSEDPYTQQNQISSIKSDYLRKRYNKEVKQGG
jgi:hypothetical protein